jgi:SRSO17 transposase
MKPEAQDRLRKYVDGIGDILNNKCRKASFAMYAMGILGDGERKSVEPIAARACPDPRRIDAVHQRLLHFLVDAEWNDHGVRMYAARYGINALLSREQVEVWILDDTGFLKQGSHSVGVQRQYTGSAGKTTNCQVGVSLSVATATQHLPIDFELYLPQSWIDDPTRRAEARIPERVTFKTKPELALDMVRRALAAGIPPGIVVSDTGYGNSYDFREAIASLGLDYAFAVNATTKVWLADEDFRRHGKARSVDELAQQIAERGGFRQKTWREGTKERLSARFAFRRVVPAHDDGHPPSERRVVWLVMEWENSEDRPTKYYLLTLPVATTQKRMVRTIKQRWRTERAYEDLKGEFGLDHYEGRRYPGWHHHVSVVLACNAFVTAERVIRFPPSAREVVADLPLALAA